MSGAQYGDFSQRPLEQEPKEPQSELVEQEPHLPLLHFPQPLQSELVEQAPQSPPLQLP